VCVCFSRVPPTFSDGGALDAAAHQRVVGGLVADDVQQGGDLRRVAEGDLVDQRPLQGVPVLHGGIAVQEVAVLLVWKTLGRQGNVVMTVITMHTICYGRHWTLGLVSLG